jgi:tRNA-Thr(GGU) m(6)t(6)A37 methyltransferase TsaA
LVRHISDAHSALEVVPIYADGLEGIRPGQDIQVLYWMHELTARDRTILRAHPMGDAMRAERGVFSLRSNVRPNPIGVSVVRVIRVMGATVVVSGLDARDNSPLLDIKASPGL